MRASKRNLSMSYACLGFMKTTGGGLFCIVGLVLGNYCFIEKFVYHSMPLGHTTIVYCISFYEWWNFVDIVIFHVSLCLYKRARLTKVKHSHFGCSRLKNCNGEFHCIISDWVSMLCIIPIALLLLLSFYMYLITICYFSNYFILWLM